MSEPIQLFRRLADGAITSATTYAPSVAQELLCSGWVRDVAELGLVTAPLPEPAPTVAPVPPAAIKAPGGNNGA